MAKRRLALSATAPPAEAPPTHDVTSRPSVGASEWPLWVALALFALSGCAALIYEIVWFQELELVLGSSPVSMGILLATFMAGIGLGSFLLPRFVSSAAHPFRIYGWIELGIGALSIAVWFEMSLVRHLYTGSGNLGGWGLILRALIAGLILLPPTILMGAALPAFARWVRTSAHGVGWLGMLYGSNTIGAVAGCTLAGFYLLRVHDIRTASFVAAGINAAVGLVALGIASRKSYLRSPVLEGRDPRTSDVWAIHLVIGISGLCALGGEIVWTRLLALLLGGTVYTFSIILAVFLAGLGIGSTSGAMIARATRHPLRALGLCQALLAAAVGWNAYMVGGSLPYWPIGSALGSDPWTVFQMDAARCLWALLPAALLWGASFPLALAAAASKGHDAGRWIGGVYAANTIGAIVGALAFTFLIVPRFGTHVAEQVLIALSALGGLTLLALSTWRERKGFGLAAGMAMMVGVALLSWTLVLAVPRPPGGLIAYGQRLAYRLAARDPLSGVRIEMPKLLYVGEGMSESVAVSDDGRVRTFHVSGKNEASTDPDDMRLQSMLGNIPALIHPQPRSVLVVGFGAGVTAGTFALYPEVQRIVICEIEPLVTQRVSQYFRGQNHNVLSDPRVQIVYDDARHFMLTSREKFDIITSDPIHPWVKGSAVLYSRDYYELVRARLNPGGVVTQWVPLYQSSKATIQNQLATFFSVFPEGTVWGNLDHRGLGYDLVLMGGQQRTVVDLGEIDARLRRPDHFLVARELQQVGFTSLIDLMSRYTTRARDLTPWLAGAQLTRDQDLSLQYRAGLELQLKEEALIFYDIAQYKIFPEDLFIGPEPLVAALKNPRR